MGTMFPHINEASQNFTTSKRIGTLNHTESMEHWTKKRSLVLDVKLGFFLKLTDKLVVNGCQAPESKINQI